MGVSPPSGPIVVAIGGHSLLDPDLPPTVANQFAVTREAMKPVADLLERGEHLVLTHGNGPQVGFMQLRSELARETLPEVPLDSLVADSQGAMGYMIERALRAELRRRGNDTPVVTIVTEVEVDPDDPAFGAPNKPIGRFYEPAEAEPARRGAGLAGHGGPQARGSTAWSPRRSRCASCSCRPSSSSASWASR